ncbi:unnamed protein product [Caenorhabditis nigoni]
MFGRSFGMCRCRRTAEKKRVSKEVSMYNNSDEEDMKDVTSNKAQLQVDVYATRTATGCDHTCVQRQKELFIVGQAVTSSKRRVSDSSQTRSKSHLVRGAGIDVQQSLKDEQCATTEAIQLKTCKATSHPT